MALRTEDGGILLAEDGGLLLTEAAPPVVPAIPAIPAGYAPVQADMDYWVTQPFAWLSGPAYFSGELHAAESWGAGGFTLAQLDVINDDDWAGWSPTSTGSQPAWSWLCPAGCSGWYEVSLTAWTTNPGTATDQVQACLYLDGSLYAQASAGWGVNGHDSGSCASVQVPLIGGVDYLQMYVYSTVATTAPATAGQYPSMEIAWMST